MPKNNWDKIQEARLRLFNLISHTPHLDWLLLTKRPENVLRLIDRDWLEMPNVWIGVSIEDQQRADERLPHLAEIPARVKFLSIEPLLGPIILNGWDGRVQRNWLVSSHPRSIDWVIIGGESGNSARSCTVDWIMGLVHTCRAAGVPVFVKQVGSSPYLKDPKGGDPNEWPEHMRVREFPNTNR
jgi:protein gp37